MSSADVAPPARTIGIIGDVHAEHVRLGRALDLFARLGVDTVVCTGDIADGTGCVDTCCAMLIEADVLTVAGNHDRWLLTERVRHIDDAHLKVNLDARSVDFLESLQSTETIMTTAGPAMLCHGVGENDLRKVWPGTERMPIERSHELDEVITDANFRYVLNGHLHYRVVVDFDALTLINAGTLVHRHRPGVSIVDFDEHSITAFELDDQGSPPERVAEASLTPDPVRRVWRDTQQFDGEWTPLTLY